MRKSQAGFGIDLQQRWPTLDEVLVKNLGAADATDQAGDSSEEDGSLASHTLVPVPQPAETLPPKAMPSFDISTILESCHTVTSEPASMQWLEQLLTEQFKAQVEQAAAMNKGFARCLMEALPPSVEEVLQNHLKARLEQQASFYNNLRADLVSTTILKPFHTLSRTL